MFNLVLVIIVISSITYFGWEFLLNMLIGVDDCDCPMCERIRDLGDGPMA